MMNPHWFKFLLLKIFAPDYVRSLEARARGPLQPNPGTEPHWLEYSRQPPSKEDLQAIKELEEKLQALNN